MKENLKILLLEDNQMDAELTISVLKADGLSVQVSRVDSEKEFAEALRAQVHDLIISDYSLPAFNGQAALKLAHASRPETPFIFYSGTIGEDAAVEVLKKGATDYVLKQRPQRLAAAVRRAMKESEGLKQQKEAQSQILAQAQLLNLAKDAIFVNDLKAGIGFWNTGAERVFGLTKEAALGRSLKELLLFKEACYLEAMEHTLDSGEWNGELDVQSPRGQKVVVSSSWTLVRDPGGAPEKILAINTDITQRKSLEAQFLRAQRLESVGTLASGVAHDLNNILAPIFMATELLRSSEMEESSAAMLDVIQQSAQRGADIVKQVLTFVRGSEGERLPLEIGALVQEVGKLVTGTFPKSIAIKCEVEPKLPPVLGDATQLHQVLMNLAINARDAMPEGGQLTLSARIIENADATGKPGALLPEPCVLVEVADSGTGIPPEALEHIFDPFFTTKAPGKGTGLGLSTVTGIVKSHGGVMTVTSELGKGTTFHLGLPCMVPAKSEPNIEASPAHRGNGELVLVVDDEQEIRESVSGVLTHHGYGVLTAPDASSGVLQIIGHKDRLRIVLTDLMMPGVDGPSFARTVKTINPAIQVILMSGSEGGKEGFPDVAHFISKPCSARELLEVVHTILQEARKEN